MVRALPVSARNLSGQAIRTVMATGLWLLSCPGFAAEAQDACFCLSHPSGAILRGCEAFQARSDFYATAVCTAPETVEVAEQLITDEWQRLAAGADRCNPCRRQTREKAPEVPRGNGDDGGTPSPHTNAPRQNAAK